MNVIVNGESRDMTPGINVATVVDDAGRGRAGIAVARNGDVIPRSRWDDVTLENGDRVEILTAAQGC